MVCVDELLAVMPPLATTVLSSFLKAQKVEEALNLLKRRGVLTFDETLLSVQLGTIMNVETKMTAIDFLARAEGADALLNELMVLNPSLANDILCAFIAAANIQKASGLLKRKAGLDLDMAQLESKLVATQFHSLMLTEGSDRFLNELLAFMPSLANAMCVLALESRMLIGL